MALNLTKTQREIVHSDKHLSITANAGSGKTTVLIEKYIKILLDEIEKIDEARIGDLVKSIVVITFTEKAGSELKKRATEEIEKRIDEARNIGNAKMLRKLEAARDSLPSAVIGTIHSFCGRILREFAVTAGVDPNFTILEGADRDFVIEKLVQDTVKKTLQKEKNENLNSDRPLFNLIRRLGVQNFYSLVKSLLYSREIVERIKREIYSKSDAEILNLWQDKIFNYVRNVFAHGKTSNILNYLQGHLTVPEITLPAQKFTTEFENDNIKQAFGRFIEFYNAIFTKNGDLKANIRKIIEAKDDEAQKEIFKRIKILYNIYDSIKNLQIDKFDNYSDYHLLLIRDTRHLLDIYEAVNSQYEIYKLKNGYLDFEDLQLKVHELLQKSEVKAELSQRYKYIMIDEYQDTNYLQYDIVRGIINEFKSRINLFIVGDDKQSIYGFRGANVEVFELTREDIVKLAGGENKILDESFRLLKGIACFVNFVFEKLMGEKISIYEVDYSPIVIGRSDDDDGRVEMLLIRRGKNEEKNWDIEEARFVARRIVQILNDESLYIYRNGKRDKIKPGDIAVLIRNRNVLKAIESAFVEYDIPYVISSGIGFYQTQEISDLINYLKFLVNTNDDVALAGILRSPFFGISDVELYRISIFGDNGSFWNKVKRFAQRKADPRPSEKLLRAVEILEEDIKVASRMSIPSLIERILLNTGYAGSSLPTRRGEQILANIQKFIATARDFESKGLTGLFEFVEQLRFLSEEHLRESQANIETAGKAVQILTIHSAKGLEFPIVVLPFLGEKINRTTEKFNIDIEYGIGFNIKYDKAMDSLPLWEVHKLISQHKNNAEEKRVLYVATTRARDMLILSGQYDDKPKQTYLNWILEALDIQKPELYAEIPISTKLKLMDKEGEIDYTMKVFVYHYRPDEEKISLAEKRQAETEIDEEKIFIQPLESKPYGEIFTATQLQTYKLCPMKFYLKFRLGLPEPKQEKIFSETVEDISAPPYEDDHSDEILGTIKGKIVHAVFERLKGEIDDEKLLREINLVIQHHGISNEKKVAELRRYAFEQVKKVIHSKFGRKIFSSTEYLTEYAISMKLDDSYLMGRIDRLYKVDDIWEIVDFKTDEINLEELEKRKKEYEVQLSVYSCLLSKLYPNQKVYRAYILFTNHPENPIEIAHTTETLKQVEKEIIETINEIRSIDLNSSVKIPSDFKEHCHLCGYFQDRKCIGGGI